MVTLVVDFDLLHLIPIHTGINDLIGDIAAATPSCFAAGVAATQHGRNERQQAERNVDDRDHRPEHGKILQLSQCQVAFTAEIRAAEHLRLTASNRRADEENVVGCEGDQDQGLNGVDDGGAQSDGEQSMTQSSAHRLFTREYLHNTWGKGWGKKITRYTGKMWSYDVEFYLKRMFNRFVQF